MRFIVDIEWIEKRKRSSRVDHKFSLDVPTEVSEVSDVKAFVKEFIKKESQKNGVRLASVTNIEVIKTQLQKILIKPAYKNEYYVKENGENGKVSKISKEKYWSLYDQSKGDRTFEVLPPITKELE